jgi:flagellar biosynthesis/type III secretory pathway ATPase
MPFVVGPEQIQAATDVRELMAAYNDVEDLVSIGAYKKGARPLTDKAIDSIDGINKFLRQAKAEGSSFEAAVAGLTTAVN